MKHILWDLFSYKILITHELVDGESLFVARIREFPDVTEYGRSANEVFDLALDFIEGSYKASMREGWDFPKPIDETSYRDLMDTNKRLNNEIALHLCTIERLKDQLA
jgi:predicted RNase H-like HicB family nuclease